MDYWFPPLPGIGAGQLGVSLSVLSWPGGLRPAARSSGPGPSGMHRALLLRLWCDDVTLLDDDPR